MSDLFQSGHMEEHLLCYSLKCLLIINFLAPMQLFGNYFLLLCYFYEIFLKNLKTSALFLYFLEKPLVVFGVQNALLPIISHFFFL